MKIIFAGTPDFAASALAALIESNHEVIAVYTQPDRPAGRGRKLQQSPVKQLALEHDIPIFQPLNLKGEQEQAALQDLQAEVMVVAAYGLILPQAVLDIPKYGCLNIHASLLPRWRGAAPIQRAIATGDSETGITIMQMNAGLDTGDILYKVSTPISNTDTGGSLHDRLAELGATAIVHTLQDLQQGRLQPEPQNDAEATYAHKLDKKEAQINWQQPAPELDRLVRAFNPWPVAYTILNDKTFRIWKAQALDTQPDAAPGTIVRCDKQGIDVACGEGTLRILELQAAGSKRMDIQAFMNGHAQQLPVDAVFNLPESP